MVRAAASVPDAMPSSTRSLRSSEALVLDAHPSPMCVVFVVATQPVLEGGVGNVGYEDGKDVLVASLDELLHARLLVSSGRLLVVEVLGMLTSYSRMELVVEVDSVQRLLVEVQKVLEVTLELEELGPALVCEILGDSILGVVGHDDVDVSVIAARQSCCGQSSGCQMPVALLLLGSLVLEVLWIVEVLPYGRYPNGQEAQEQGTAKSSVAHTGSATGSNHSLDEQVACRFSSNVHDHIGQIKGPGVRNEVVPGLLCMHQVHLGVQRACVQPTLLCKVLLPYIFTFACMLSNSSAKLESVPLAVAMVWGLHAISKSASAAAGGCRKESWVHVV
eukprot:6212477-Pleurochrysis_carterae.AAC.1